MIDKIIGIIVVSIIFILELSFSFFEKEKARVIVKPFCMLSLCLLAFLFGYRGIFLYIGLGLSFLGDILLIFKKNQVCFIIGATSFFFAHISYAYLFSTIIDVQLWHYIALGIFGLILPLALYKTLLPIAKKGILAYSVTLYFYAIFLELLFSSIIVFSKFSIGALLILIGILFFFISDFCIFYRKYVNDFKKQGFVVMLTYLIAQLLIVLGVLFLF